MAQQEQLHCPFCQPPVQGEASALASNNDDYQEDSLGVAEGPNRMAWPGVTWTALCSSHGGLSSPRGPQGPWTLTPSWLCFSPELLLTLLPSLLPLFPVTHPLYEKTQLPRVLVLQCDTRPTQKPGSAQLCPCEAHERWKSHEPRGARSWACPQLSTTGASPTGPCAVCTCRQCPRGQGAS